MFDLDALAIEAEDEPPFEFRWNGETFTMPTLQQLDWREQAVFFDREVTSEGRMKLLLGAKRFQVFCQKRASTARVQALLDEWWKFQGITDEGESEASADS